MLALEVHRVVFLLLVTSCVVTGLVSVATSLRSGSAKLRWSLIMLLLPPVGVLAYLRQSWGNPRRHYVKLLAGLAAATILELIGASLLLGN